MKKTIATAILAMSTMAYGTTDNWYVGLGYDGVSIKTDISSDISLQATYGGFGTLSGFKAKGLYKFQNNKDYNLYGYGGLMYSSDNITNSASGGFGTSVKSEIDITTKGLEFGVGVEYDLRKVMNNNIPLFVSLEAGYRASTTDVDGKTTFNGYSGNNNATSSAEYDYSGAIGGMWIHYKF